MKAVILKQCGREKDSRGKVEAHADDRYAFDGGCAGSAHGAGIPARKLFGRGIRAHPCLLRRECGGRDFFGSRSFCGALRRQGSRYSGFLQRGASICERTGNFVFSSALRPCAGSAPLHETGRRRQWRSFARRADAAGSRGCGQGAGVVQRPASPLSRCRGDGALC